MTKRDEILRLLQGRDPRQWPMSVRDIQYAVDLGSTSTVHHHLRILESEGLVERDGRKGFRARRAA